MTVVHFFAPNYCSAWRSRNTSPGAHFLRQPITSLYHLGTRTTSCLRSCCRGSVEAARPRKASSPALTWYWERGVPEGNHGQATHRWRLAAGNIEELFEEDDVEIAHVILPSKQCVWHDFSPLFFLCSRHLTQLKRRNCQASGDDIS